MKLLLLLTFILFSNTLNAQTVFNYKYTEVCSGEVKTVRTVVENHEDRFTIFFFGEYRNFSYSELADGTYERWLTNVYKKWTEYYPCAELSALLQETTKKVAEQNEADISQPLIVVSSDLAYYSGGELKTGIGYSEANRLTGVGKGGVGSLGNNQVSSFGIFRLTPISTTINTVENFNIIFTTGNLLGNLLHGVYYKDKKGSIFAFNALTFGFLNGFGFQDNTIVVGGGTKIYSDRKVDINTIIVTSYTYYVRIFKISYWLEDYIKINPNLSVTYKLSPSFGLGLTGTVTYRTDQRQITNTGVLLGGKLFF